MKTLTKYTRIMAPDCNGSLAHKLFFLIFLTASFLMPLELAATQAAHGILADRIGEYYILLHPFSAILAYVVIFGDKKFDPITIAILVCVGGILVSSVLGGAEVRLTFRYIMFGLGSVFAGYILARWSNLFPYFVRAYLAGVVLWCGVILVAYLLYFSRHGDLLSIPSEILSLRAPGNDIANETWFFKLAGNVNKVSNVALLQMILAYASYAFGYMSRRIHYLIQLLLIAVLLICFSRGAFLVGFFLALCFWGYWALLRLRKSGGAGQFLEIGCLMGAPFVLSISTPVFVRYWFDLQTVATRAKQLADVGAADKPDLLYHQFLDLFFGYGVGRYGELHFGQAVAGTHNLFVDVWTHGGIPAAAALVSMFVVALCIATKRIVLNGMHFLMFGWAGVAAIFVLSFREYDLAYLYATASGGLLLGVFLGLSMRSSR